MTVCRLDTLPDRRTFDRRFKIMPVRDVIAMMGTRFVTEGIVDCTITSVDSSMIRARNGRIWHRKQMVKGEIPRSALIQMQGGDSLEPRDGCLGINCTCHAV
jgi:hypothetical protein